MCSCVMNEHEQSWATWFFHISTGFFFFWKCNVPNVYFRRGETYSGRTWEKRKSWGLNGRKRWRREGERGRESSLRDKSSSVERWQGWSWMQPLCAWWLIATKMSTSPFCSHSARGVFKNTAALTSRGGDRVREWVFLKSRAYATVLFLQDPKIKKMNSPVWELLWLAGERFGLSCPHHPPILWYGYNELSY